MDAIGAQHLRRAIEQYHHWRLAAAVRAGLQSERDPDAADLVELDEGLRRYRSREGRSFEKRLVDGCWI